MIGAQKSERCAREGRNILLISDDASLRTLVSALLDRVGYGCAAASTAELNAVFAQGTFDAVILDTNQPEDATEIALDRIKANRPALWSRVLLIAGERTPSPITELMERHNFHQTARAALHPELWIALQDLLAPQSVSEMTFHSMQAAELRFDSSRGQVVTGLRGPRLNCRQLIFQHRASTVDLLIEPREDSGRIAITGQILNMPRTGDREGVQVLLVSGIHTMSRTSTNRLGEFCLDCTPLQEACVEIRLREGAWVSLNLGKLDWALRRSTD